jgi:HD-GYP domain-containing protein (c-di-GMP phosphodiesterase class II)
VAYSLLLGFQMMLSREELQDLWLASTLHDIGKIATPDRILGKPSPLDRDEVEIMKRHPVDGAAIVQHLANDNVLKGVRNHHERVDGKGYPDGLSGDGLPPVARIIAVADTYDAMTTSRPYRAGLPPERAAQEIRASAGTQLCPSVVEAFRALYESGRFTVEAGEEVLRSITGM